MKIKIASPLQSYTKGLSQIEINKPTLNEVIDELESKFPGIKFRFIDEQDQIRKHMTIFVNGVVVKDIFISLEDNAEIFIVQLISGG